MLSAAAIALANGVALIPGGGAAAGAAVSAFGYLLRCGTCLKILGVVALVGWTALHVHRADVAHCTARIEDDHQRAKEAAEQRDGSIAEQLGRKYAPVIKQLAADNAALKKKVDDGKKQKPAAARGACKLGAASSLL